MVDKSEKLYAHHGNFKKFYQNLPAIYSIAITEKLKGYDDRPVRSFSMRDDDTFEELMMPLNGTDYLYNSHRIVIIQLSKFTGHEKNIDDGKREILEFLSNKEFSQRPNDVILKAEEAFDKSRWNESEKRMYDLERRIKENAELRDFYHEKEGIKKGIEQRNLELIGKCHSQGMTVDEIAEFLNLDLEFVKEHL